MVATHSMGVLRSIEHRIESLVEGAFGRAFRSHVQPVELARKLAKEMDEHKTVSVSRVYVPNEYVLYLSPQDREHLPPEEALLTELGDYLSEHARREGYALLSTPRVTLEEDEDLAVGEFGIATRMVQPRRTGPEPVPEVVADAEPGATRIFKPAPETAAVTPEEAERLELARMPAVLVVDGKRHELAKRGVVLGRSRDCDIRLDDPNISRRHAEIRQEDGGYWIVDLGSTNGVEINGERVERARLSNDDRIVLGKTDIVFELPL
jgi:FHA domain-containing protein